MQSETYFNQINYQEIFDMLELQYIFREVKNQERELINKIECCTQFIETKKWLHKIKLDQTLSETTVGDFEEFKANLDAEIHKKGVINGMQQEISSSSSDEEGGLESGRKHSKRGGDSQSSEDEIDNFSPDFLQNQAQQEHSQRVMAQKLKSQKDLQGLGLDEEERKSRNQNMEDSESVSAYEQEDQPLRRP